MKGLVSSGASLSLCFTMRDAVPASLLCARMRRCLPQGFAGRVGEWLKPADCKSAAPCGLRRFESSPVHHSFAQHINPEAGYRGGPRHCDETKRQPGPDGCVASAGTCVKMVDEFRAWVAQLVERVLGKDEVTGSIPVPGSRNERSTAGVTQR